MNAIHSAFDRFYKGGQRPADALALAIADAHAEKLGEFASGLVAYRESHDSLLRAVELLLPFAESSASVQEQVGWCSRAQSAVDVAKAAIARANLPAA